MIPTELTPIDIAKAFLKAMEPLDYDTALAYVAAGCEYTNPPPIGTVHGPAGIRAVLEPFFAPTLDNKFRILREALSGQVVILERLDRRRLADRIAAGATPVAPGPHQASRRHRVARPRC